MILVFPNFTATKLFNMENNHQKTNMALRTARLLSFAFAIFISIFAMDVFSEGLTIGKTILALLLHLVPTFFILLVTILSWKRELIGCAVFFVLGVLYIFLAMHRGFHWSAFAAIAGPLFLLGTLYFISWNQRRQMQA
jgi:hypothetical protein